MWVLSLFLSSSRSSVFFFLSVCLSLSFFWSVHLCARVRGGRFYFTRIIILLEDRGADSSSRRAEPRGEPRERRAYLWMDSLSTFGRVSRSVLLRFSLFLSFSLIASLFPLVLIVACVLTRRIRG